MAIWIFRPRIHLLVLVWFVLAPALVGLSTQPVLAAGQNLYVAPTGSDSNIGTLAAPFQTIQHCANIVQAGDTCIIRAGTYRETIQPPISGTINAPITFKPYNDEVVTISGADVLSNWTSHHGTISKPQCHGQYSIQHEAIPLRAIRSLLMVA